MLVLFHLSGWLRNSTDGRFLCFPPVVTHQISPSIDLLVSTECQQLRRQVKTNTIS